jgi:hypothetical protein
MNLPMRNDEAIDAISGVASSAQVPLQGAGRPIKWTALYFTPSPVPSCPVYEPNSNDPVNTHSHSATSSTPVYVPSLPWRYSCAGASLGEYTDVSSQDECAPLLGPCFHRQEVQQGTALLADVLDDATTYNNITGVS